jgi:NAD(P)H-hydrate epimerase
MIFTDNSPEIWKSKLPWPPSETGHKYNRGHIVIAGGMMTGAARLAAQASMRIGAGLCTIAGRHELMGIYLVDSPHLLFESMEDIGECAEKLADPRRNAAIIGPGQGQDEPEKLRHAVLSVLKMEKSLVLDADALTVFSGQTDQLTSALHSKCVLTPHEGEFKRLFPGLKGSKAEQAGQAAALCGCTILLKGSETAIASPGREIVLNTHASPWLATAGAGDVLAGMIGGLMAQGMESFNAACAAAWIHGEAGIRLGPGLVAPDLIQAIPSIIRDFS